MRIHAGSPGPIRELSSVRTLDPDASKGQSVSSPEMALGHPYESHRQIADKSQFLNRHLQLQPTDTGSTLREVGDEILTQNLGVGAEADMPSRRKKEQDRSAPESVVDRLLFYGLALFVFAMPLFFWPGSSEYGYSKTIFALVGISFLGILWAVAAWKKRQSSVRILWPLIPILGFVAASFLSLISAADKLVALQSVIVFASFVTLFALIAGTVRAQRQVNLLLTALLTSAVLSAGLGLAQYGGMLPGADEQAGLGAMISTFGNRNYLGGFLAYQIFPAGILVVRWRSRLLKAISIASIGLVLGTIILIEQTGTTVSLLLAAIVVAVGLAIFRPKLRLRPEGSWLLALALVVAVIVPTIHLVTASPREAQVPALSADSSSAAAPSSVSLWDRNSGSIREADWWIGWEMFLDHPLTGVGLGNYKLSFLPYRAEFLASPRGESFDQYIMEAAQAHNEYVQIVAETGGIGAASLAAFVVVFLITGWRRIARCERSQRLDLLLLVGGLSVFFAHAAVSFPAHLPASGLVAVVLGGLFFAPVYGDAPGLTVRLPDKALPCSLAVAVAIGTAISILAILDLRANLLMESGVRQSQLGNPYGAASLLSESLCLDFAPRQTHYYLGLVQRDLGHVESAEEHLARSLVVFGVEEAYLNYANFMVSQGKYDQARGALDVLLASRPRREISLRSRYLDAMLSAQQGALNVAVVQLEQLREEAPQFELAHIGLGAIYRILRRPTESRESYRTALNLIDRRLEGARERLNRRGVLTASEYAELNSEIELLEGERESVLEELANLPEE